MEQIEPGSVCIVCSYVCEPVLSSKQVRTAQKYIRNTINHLSSIFLPFLELYIPTDLFTISETLNPSIDEFLVVRKRQSTDFGWSIRVPIYIISLGPFPAFPANSRLRRVPSCTGGNWRTAASTAGASRARGLRAGRPGSRGSPLLWRQGAR